MYNEAVRLRNKTSGIALLVILVIGAVSKFI